MSKPRTTKSKLPCPRQALQKRHPIGKSKGSLDFIKDRQPLSEEDITRILAVEKNAVVISGAGISAGSQFPLSFVLVRHTDLGSPRFSKYTNVEPDFL